MTRHDGSGSPQDSQSGGVRNRTDCQHGPHTGPHVGRSRISPQAAQDGARTTERTASSRPKARITRPVGLLRGGRDVDALGVAPQPLEAVEQTRLAREDVHDEIEVVDEYPP